MGIERRSQSGANSDKKAIVPTCEGLEVYVSRYMGMQKARRFVPVALRETADGC